MCKKCRIQRLKIKVSESSLLDDDFFNFTSFGYAQDKLYILIFTFCIMVLGTAGSASADLIGYWKLDEGSGSIAYDSGIAANDGTLHGGPQWVSGMIGGALEFDGSDDYIDCGNDPSLSINNEISAFSNGM